MPAFQIRRDKSMSTNYFNIWSCRPQRPKLIIPFSTTQCYLHFVYLQPYLLVKYIFLIPRHSIWTLYHIISENLVKIVCIVDGYFKVIITYSKTLVFPKCSSCTNVHVVAVKLVIHFGTYALLLAQFYWIKPFNYFHYDCPKFWHQKESRTCN